MCRGARASGRRRVVRWAPLGLALLALLATVLVATGVGSADLSLGSVSRGVWHGLTGQVSGTDDVIVWRIRIPRVILAGMVGGTLAISGVVYQAVFRNPLAEPYLLGVASGAGFGAALVIAFGAGIPLFMRFGLPIIAFAFGLLTVAAVVLLARQGGRVPVLSLILAGAVLGSIFTAATSFVMLASRERASGILAWLLGSFSLVGWGKVVAILPLFLLAAALITLSGRALNLLQLGDEQAAQLGLPVERIKLLLVTAATLATAAAVSVSGIIGFIGLMVPHAVRLAFGPDHRALIPLSLILGALFMILADLVARTLIAPAEIPIGVITALVGGPFFLYLLRRQRASR